MKRTATTLILLTILALCVYGTFIYEPSHAQTTAAPVSSPEDGLKQIPKLIKDTKATGAVFAPRQLVGAKSRLFQSGDQLVQNERQLASVVGDGVVFELNTSAIANLLEHEVEYLTLSLPNGRGETIELELVKTNIFAPGFSVKTAAPTSEHLDGNWGVHYRGIVKDNEHSLAAISIFKNEIAGFFSSATDGNSVIGRLGGDNPSNTHIVYAEKDLKVEREFSCNTPDVATTPLPNSLLQAPGELPGSCMRIYVEADFDLFQNRGSVANTMTYINALFNQSATLFANDGLTVSLSEVFVWNAQSPYAGLNDSDSLLTTFQQIRTSFNGYFGQLLALRGGGGLAATIDGFCSTADLRACFSGVHPTFANVPTYSWSVEVFTHELGHLFGSFHTHACVWNGNNTAIDGCGPAAGFVEGTCSPAPIPGNGGTIMSYCHLSPNPGINFTNGFGTQPRNLMLNRLNGAACLSSCAAVTIGQGAPNPQLFIDAANRGNFLQFAILPPLTPVHRWDCTFCDPANPTWAKGLIQDFDDITPGVHNALMLADTNPNFVAQLYGGMWDKFTQLSGVNAMTFETGTIGYPVADRNCSDFNSSCFTDAQLVSSFATSYHYQRFQGGTFVLHRSGSRNGQTFEVHGPIRARWQTLQGPTSSFGLPISDEYSADGKRRNDFEGGSICYNPSINQTEDNCALGPPENDNFANAQMITNASGTTTGINVEATRETGEPDHAGNQGGKSVWYRWQAPINGTATITTTGSNFDTLLAVYTGNAVNGLSLIASNDDDPLIGFTRSRVMFTATAGTTYRIAVDGFNGQTGSITLNWSVSNPPAPVALTPTNVTANGFTANWMSASGAIGYRLDVSTSNTFSTFVSGYQNLDVGNVLSHAVTGLAANTLYFYRVRAYSSSSTSDDSAPISVGTSSGLVQVTVMTSPGGLAFSVDGVTYTSLQTFSWAVGSTHTISTTAFQNEVSGSRFAWSNWSDGGAISHTISPTGGDSQYIAFFNFQFLLTMNTEPGGTATPSTSWFNPGENVEISATPAPGFRFGGWVGSGVVSTTGMSNPATVTMLGPITQTARFTQGPPAVYDAALKAPRCGQPGSACDSGTLLNGRAMIVGGDEPNQPNTINNSCADGVLGSYRFDESLESIRVSTVDGSNFAPGKTVRIDVLVWAASIPSTDFLDLYYAANAGSPNWVYLTTVQATVPGPQILSATYTLPAGASSQAVRGRFRFNGSPMSCGVIGGLEDHDDLIFATDTRINVALPANGGVATASSTFTNQYPASNTINGERAGANSTTGGVFNGWLSSSPTMPQWVQVNFGQMRNIQEIDVFTVQDNYQNPSPPTEAMTFSLYGLQGFEAQYWNGSSWVTITGGHVTGNNKVWKQLTFPSIATDRIRVLTSASPDSYSRITEIEAWSDLSPPPAVNVALAANGGMASASSTFSNQYPASNAINGERAGGNSTTGGVFNGWLGSTATMPQWLQVDFGEQRSIQEIDVFTVQDNYPNPVTPTQAVTFTLYGLQGFEVQYWNGSAWVVIPGGTVTGNNKVWKQFTFPSITTNKIRVLSSASPDSYSRVTEIEAWSNSTPPPPSGINVALPANGGVASASSTFSNNYPASNAINGERAGGNSTTGGVFNGWIGSSPVMPQWLQIDFGQVRNIQEIDVFTVQDNYQNPALPALDMIFSLYGLTGFDVQYWNGSSWVTIPGGSVTGNNKIWRQFTFPTVATSKIRVLSASSPDLYTRLTEVEAWSTGP